MYHFEFWRKMNVKFGMHLYSVIMWICSVLNILHTYILENLPIKSKNNHVWSVPLWVRRPGPCLVTLWCPPNCNLQCTHSKIRQQPTLNILVQWSCTKQFKKIKLQGNNKVILIYYNFISLEHQLKLFNQNIESGLLFNFICKLIISHLTGTVSWLSISCALIWLDM